MRMLAREARGTAVFTRGVEFGRNPETPRRKPDKGGEAERRGLRDRQQDCGRGREKERKETKREKKNTGRKRQLARVGAGLPLLQSFQEPSPQHCRRQRWVAPEILTCQTPSALRGPNQN